MSGFFNTKALMRIRQNMASKVTEFTGVDVLVYGHASVVYNVYREKTFVEATPIRTVMRFTPEQGLKSLAEFNAFFDGGDLPIKVLFPQDLVLKVEYRIEVVQEELLEGDVSSQEFTNVFSVVDVAKADISQQYFGTKVVHIAPFRG